MLKQRHKWVVFQKLDYITIGFSSGQKKRLWKFSTVQAVLTKNDDDLVLLVHAKKLFNAKRMHFGGHRGAAEAEQSFFPESLNESGLPKLII